MSETDDETVEVQYDQYERMRDGYIQCNAEGWFPVIRRDNDPVEARPVDRQEDIYEGERTESGQWLIREPNGETYTISNEVFEERYDEQGSLRTERFAVDLSWDGTVGDDVPDDEIEFEGWTVVAEVAAIIDVRTQSVVSLDVIRVDLEQDNWQGMDGIPLELLYDSPMFNTVSDATDSEEDHD